MESKIVEASTARDGYVPYFANVYNIYDRNEILTQPEFVGEFLLDYLLNDYEDFDWFYEDTSWLDDFVYQAIEDYKKDLGEK